ncbi:MAG: response regulator [Elusimicrobia bacterium]|nr:response regulator [Elusimicrobiota bacterium]
MADKTYTTYEIAKFCDVYPSSVIHWIDAGKLKAYVTPGGHHRVMREDLIRFLQHCGIAVPKELGADERRKVFIVDDDVELARLIDRAFRKQPQAFQTEVFHTGVEALIRIGHAVPDLVILDIVLPKMDGCQVCKILKTRPQTREVKIIGISGKRFPMAEKELARYRVDAFYRKPLDLEELLAKSAELLRVELKPAAEPSREA